MTNRIQQIRNRLEQEKGKRAKLQNDLEDLLFEINQSGHRIERCEQAREIIREVGLKTQQQLQYHISDITTMALADIFDDPYKLVAEFVQRRNKTECDLLFERDGERVDPIDATGGGAVDVASLALRIVAWSMQNPHSRNTIILDEPLKFLDTRTDRLERASQMIKELSERLDLQFIIVTHEDTLAQYADKTFHVSIRNKISKIEET